MAEKNTNTKDTAKTKKEGLGKRISRFFREYKSELKKISWPTFSEVVRNSLITLAVVLIVGIFIWLVDWGLNSGRDAIFTAVSNTDAQQTAVIGSGSDIVSAFTAEEQAIIDSELTKKVGKGSEVLTPDVSEYMALSNSDNVIAYYHGDKCIAAGEYEDSVNALIKNYIKNNLSQDVAAVVSAADAQ